MGGVAESRGVGVSKGEERGGVGWGEQYRGRSEV